MYRLVANSALLIYDRLTGRNVASCSKNLEKTQWMKREELRGLQVSKLKALLKQAYENVPYYHRCFKENKFYPTDFKTLEDLSKIPVLHRSSIRSEADRLLARNADERKLVKWKTNGTTDVPLSFFRSRTDIGRGTAAELRSFGWGGYKIGDKAVLIHRVSPHDLGNVEDRLKLRLNRTRLFNVAYLSENYMESFCSAMQKFKPQYIISRATPVTNILAVFLLENRRFRISPQAVFTGGQTLLPHYRANIENAFKCRVYDWYGSAEMSHVASQCGFHDSLHVSEENVLVEIQKDGEKAACGEEGTVLLTNLDNFAMPFIRYDVGDRGRILDDECSCGRELSLFRPIGRTREYFVHSDGTFTIFRDVNTVFENVPLEDFQIVQSSLDEIVIRIVRRSDYTESHSQFILNNISPGISAVARIRIELVDSLPYTSSGKIQHIISKIPTKYT